MNCPLQTRFYEVFKEELGAIKSVEVKIFLQERPLLEFFRTVRQCLRAKLEKELHRLKDHGIISTLKFANQAAPIVQIVMIDLNSLKPSTMFVKVKCYFLLMIENLFAKVGVETVYTLLDLSCLYQQVDQEE